MIVEYVQAALENAHYEIIDDDEPFYGEVPQLEGVWASGKTLEDCRHNLAEVVEGWILVRSSQGLDVPSIGGFSVTPVKELMVA